MAHSRFEAVLWDFGGVFTTSPFEAFNRYESAHGLPKDFIRSVNATNPRDNAWAQLEASTVSIEEFDRQFRNESLTLGFEVPGRDVLGLLSGDVRPEMVHALEVISRTHQVGCITNNVAHQGEGPGMAGSTTKAAEVKRIMGMFSVVIESSKVGVRKPDPAIYQMALDQLGVAAAKTIFLDDLGINLKPARQMGMTTIKVIDPKAAIAELEHHLELSLQ